jgi:hypothetical protein
MAIPEITYTNHFGEFVIHNLAEIQSQSLLFETQVSGSHADQLGILQTLEDGLPLLDGSTFSNDVHFRGALQTPVQRWFPYREGFSIKLVNTFLNELGIRGPVFDPFAGSGTTLLASRTNNLAAIGMDVNPISVLVAQVENEQYDQTDLETLRTTMLQLDVLEPTIDLFHTPFELADKVFNAEILQTLLELKRWINQIENFKIKNLFFVAWLAIIESVSNIKKEGNGIKYKNRKRTADGYINVAKTVWESRVFPANKFDFVKNRLLEQLTAIKLDLESKYGRCVAKPMVFQGDCLAFPNFFTDAIQLSFFSPPYCNCFDYFEIHKVDLWLGDFVSSREEFRKLRSMGFRSNTNAINHKPVQYKNIQLEKLIALFEPAKLWNEKIPIVVRGYFDDMRTLLAKLHRQTIRHGFVGIVIGNSAYSGVIIPTDSLTAQIAREVGFTVKNVFVTRHLTTSSQQKQELEPLRYYLRESILVLQK